MKKTTAFALAAALCVAPALVVAQCCPPEGEEKAEQAPVAAKVEKGVQKATVVIDGTYSPSVVTVAKGKPVELTFVRKEKGGCGGTLLVKSLKVKKEIKTGESTVVKFTPNKAGEIVFTCGMEMLKGKIIVK